MLKRPEGMNEVVYFTRRTLGDKGKIMAWALKKTCDKCSNALMGKPVEKGKVKIRAKEYVCPSCGNVEEKLEHEKKLEVSVDYTCPHCEHKGEATTPYQRKTFKGAKSFIFNCGNCQEKIGISKKMKKFKQ